MPITVKVNWNLFRLTNSGSFSPKVYKKGSGRKTRHWPRQRKKFHNCEKGCLYTIQHPFNFFIHYVSVINEVKIMAYFKVFVRGLTKFCFGCILQSPQIF